MDEGILKDIFLRMDVLEKKHISYTQFTAACISSDGLLSEDKLKAAFSLWDIDRDGVISFKDLETFLSNDFPTLRDTKFFQELLEEVKGIPQVNSY